MVFSDAAGAAEFWSDSPLEMFVVRFVPAADTSPLPTRPPEPDPEEPISLADELRAMGLM
jgi:hypothetical protein